MRLKSEIIIAAELKRAQSLGLFATIISRGNENAGQIYILLNKNNVDFMLLGPPMGASINDEGEKLWDYPLGQLTLSQQQIDEYMNRIRKFDGDIYLLEIEDKALTYRPNGIFPVNEDDEFKATKQRAENLFKK